MPLHTLLLRFSVLSYLFVNAALSAQMLHAQTVSSGGTYSWTRSSTWGLQEGFPGSSPESTVASINTGSQPVTLTNASPSFRIGMLRLSNTSEGTLTLRPNPTQATITVGTIQFDNAGAVLVIGAGMRFVLDSLVVTPLLGDSLPPPMIVLEANAMLDLRGTSADALSGVLIRGSGANSTIILRNGFNRSLLPAARFSAGTTGNLQARLLLDGTFTLDDNLRIGANGVMDLGGGTNKLILSTSDIVCLGVLMNTSSNSYFVTNNGGSVRLGNVGNTLFPIGPSASLYAPCSIVNNALGSEFSMRVQTPITRSLPAAAAGSNVQQVPVNLQWSVAQHTNISAGIAVLITPQWPASSEGAGFNRSIASVNRYNSTSIVQSSTPAVASPVNSLANYYQSTLVVTQTWSNGIGQLTNLTAIVVTSAPVPVILSITPRFFVPFQAFTIVGQRFTGVTAVRFGGVNAASFTVSAAGDTIRAVAGQGASGQVTVIQAGSTVTSAIGLPSPPPPPQTPVIIRTAPDRLLAGLGDMQSTIIGTGFGSNTLRVNVAGSGLQGTIVPNSSSPTSVAIIVPRQFTRNVGTITLTVTSVDKNPISTTVTIQAPNAPIITSIQPSSTVASTRPFTLTLQGRNFGMQSTLSLNTISLRQMRFQTSDDGLLTVSVEVPANAESGILRLTNLNGQTTSATITITPNTSVLGILSHFNISPNPTTDNLHIQATLEHSARWYMRIVDALGREVYREEHQVQSGVVSRTLDVSQLHTGAYMLELRENEVLRGVRRFIKH